MEWFETIVQSLSYIGVIEKLMSMTTTDIAVVYLISKPAFLFTAIIMVATEPRNGDRELDSDKPDMRDLLR